MINVTITSVFFTLIFTVIVHARTSLTTALAHKNKAVIVYSLCANMSIQAESVTMRKNTPEKTVPITPSKADQKPKDDDYYTPFSLQKRRPELISSESSNQGEIPMTWSGEKNVWQAASEGEFRALQSLFASGLTVDQRDDEDYTPLMYAAEEGNSDAVAFLLNQGADIDAINLYGWTSLMAATVRGHVDTVKLLLGRGANPKIEAGTLTPNPGDTPLKIAKRKGYSDIVDLLERAELQR